MSRRPEPPAAADLVELAGGAALTPEQRKRLFGRGPRKTGHAAPPGTGPEGETCRSCAHKVTVETRARRTFVKCGLRAATWTNSYGTDIRASDPACHKWTPKPPKEKSHARGDAQPARGG